MNRNQLIQLIIQKLQEISKLLESLKKQPPMPPQPANSERLYKRAYSYLGIDPTPDDQVPDVFSCVYSLCQIVYDEFGEEIGGKRLENTIELNQALSISPKFQRTNDPGPGDIAVAVTEGGTHGHAAIMGIRRTPASTQRYMSNNSLNGLWLDGYTKNTWDKY